MDTRFVSQAKRQSQLGPAVDYPNKKITMWKATLLVFVLLNMADEVISSNVSTSSAPFLGKLLVIPMDGSHWVGMKAIAQEMGRRGHQVTVVIPEISVRMGPGKHYQTVTFPVPYDKAYIDTVISANKGMMSKEALPFMEKMRKGIAKFQKIRRLLLGTAESLLFNDTLISHLQQQGFDAVLTDPMVPTGSLMARKFGLPTINLLRGIPCSLDIKSAGCPSPPSFVPRFFTGYTDKMSFKQRIINTIVALFEPLMCRLLYWHFDQITSEFLGEDTTVAEILSDSDIWLLRLDFASEFPRPLMPNMVLVGGINCNVRNPLPDDLQPWVSGQHGFVVMTFGTMVADMPEETRKIFFDAFKQIPQKVIWRYNGSVPEKVPENVKLMKWVPQNDLLAHPGARAFLTHAGSHGLFEGLCHAVPMLMMPLTAEQPDNAQKMANKGAGVVLNIQTITTEILLDGLKEVINNPKYKENLQKLSAIHNDRPIDPLELSVYWTEYVMKHKGVKHLKATVNELNWIQYYSLDVTAFLLIVTLLFTMIIIKGLKLCYSWLSWKRKQD
ncbi:UDP-glucuronosyltransferase-like isoform X1 [Periophthalmus magnuspinnatus]|uniref:UDP-glucuronosyltransferase-like isoform X1 n=1 Tax=Periophthalmus magnuspinnatus TaxID=409849 RepID=UPI00145A91B9|nr:UDP-glucuronosyltransferase-like isoform X1 [Periophthalmus magnuspinnatus]